MKKFLKVLGIILLVVILVIGVLTALSWKYVSALITGLTTDEAQLGQQRVENTETSLSSINDYMGGELRDLTEDEKSAIQSGELSQTAVMAQIIAEAAGIELPSLSDFDEDGNLIVQSPNLGLENGGENGATGEQPAGQGTSQSGPQVQQPSGQPAGEQPSGQTAGEQPSSQTSGQQPSEEQSAPQTVTPSKEQPKPVEQPTAPSASYDQLVAACVSKLYGLQGQYTGQIAGLVSRAKAEYDQQKKAGNASKSALMSKYAGEVASMESSCDAKVEAALGELSSQLKAIGADTAIVGELRSAYNREKSNQRAAYANRYLK